MNPSQQCYDLIKSFEGLKLKAYPDPGTGGKPWTIGYGSTMYRTGDRIQPGDEITLEQAEALLKWEVDNKSSGVNAVTQRVNLTQNQFDALVSFAYNVGLGNFYDSTLLRKVKVNPKDPLIEKEFLKWVRAKGKVLPGLEKRRKKEAELYFKSCQSGNWQFFS